MDDLFRFWTLRAAKPTQAEARDVIAFSPEANREAAREPHASATRVAALVQASQRFVKSPASLSLGQRMLNLARKLGSPPFLASEVRSATEAEVGHVANLIASDDFRADASRLADSLLAVKFLSSAQDVDVSQLIALRRLYTLVARSTAGEDELDWLPIVYLQRPTVPDAASPVPTPPPPSDGGSAHSDAERRLQDIDSALVHLAALRSSDFLEPHPTDDRPCPAVSADLPSIGGIAAHSQARAFRLNTNAMRRIPGAVADTLSEHDLSIAHDSVPNITLRLEQAKLALSQTLADGRVTTSAKKVVTLGKVHIAGDLGVGGEPKSPMPKGKGSVAPIGIGDLLVVKEHTKAYVGGDVAHIENVLKSEKMSRETRRLERNETTFLTETEKATEEERDTQSTDRFSLKRETTQTIKSDLAIFAQPPKTKELS